MRYETIKGTDSADLANKLNALLAQKNIRVISADLASNSALIEAQDEPTGESVTTITVQKADGRFFSEVAKYDADGSVKSSEKTFKDEKGQEISEEVFNKSEEEYQADKVSPASDVETPQNTQESPSTAPESASVDNGAGEPQKAEDEALEATLRNNVVNPN